MVTVTVAGTTGLCGSQFLKTCLESPSVSKLYGFSRREQKVQGPKLTNIVADSSEWFDKIPSTDVFFSGVATTRGQEGGFSQQHKIDHDLQYDLAKAAKAKGVHTFILVSSAGAGSIVPLPYLKMKLETEQAIIGLSFPKTIILRPGALLGRENQRNFFEGFFTNISLRVHRSFAQSLMGYPVYASEVAEAALKSVEDLPDGVHYLESSEILRISTPANESKSPEGQ